MVYMGAEGETTNAIAQVLGYNPTLNKVDIAYLIKMLMEQGEEDDSVEVANRILVDGNIKVSSLYQKIMKTYFHSSIEELSHNNDKKLVENINKWIISTTHGRITEILTETDLFKIDKKDHKKLILLDAIYFKGRWAYQFDKKLTKPRKFWTSKDQFVTVDMMETIVSFVSCLVILYIDFFFSESFQLLSF